MIALVAADRATYRRMIRARFSSSQNLGDHALRPTADVELGGSGATQIVDVKGRATDHAGCDLGLVEGTSEPVLGPWPTTVH
jgi:hypothetical protein